MFQEMNREELMMVDGGGWYEDAIAYAQKIGQDIMDMGKELLKNWYEAELARYNQDPFGPSPWR